MRKLLSILTITAAVCATMSCTKDGGLFGKGSVKAKIVEEYMDGSNALYWGEGATFGLFNSSKANEKYRLSSGPIPETGNSNLMAGTTAPPSAALWQCLLIMKDPLSP